MLNLFRRTNKKLKKSDYALTEIRVQRTAHINERVRHELPKMHAGHLLPDLAHKSENDVNCF